MNRLAYLVDDASCTDVQVSDFRVTHKSIRQTNTQTVCSNFSVWVGLFEFVHDGCIGVANGIALWVLVGRDTPAVNANETHLFLGCLLFFWHLSTAWHSVYTGKV